MSMLAKMPALDLIEAEIIRLEARHKCLQNRRDRVLIWQYRAYENLAKGAICRAKLQGQIDATWRASRALHKVYMSVLNS